MTDVRGKPAMLACYCEQVKRIEVRLRLLRLDVAKSGHMTHRQWVERTKLAAQARALYELRSTARSFARARREALREIQQAAGTEVVRKVPRRVAGVPATPPEA